MADGLVLRSKPLGSVDRPPQSESESEGAVDVASESPKNTFSITPMLFDASYPGNPREHPHKSLLPESTVIVLYIFVPNSMGLSSLKFLWWVPKDACVLKQSA